MSNILKLIELESKEINHLFEKASIEGSGTPQEISDRRESALSNFLKKFFPFPYRIGKGNIRDSYGENSASIDCIVLNPHHPYTTSNELNYSIILADAVDFAIELKPDLSSEKEIVRSLKQIETVKKLRRVNTSLPNWGQIGEERSFEKQELGRTIPGIIFANKTYVDKENLYKKIVEYYESNSVPHNLQFDLIVINNDCVIFNRRPNSYYEPPQNYGSGLYISHSKELTLAIFLLLLNRLPQSHMTINKPILNHYLKREEIFSGVPLTLYTR